MKNLQLKIKTIMIIFYTFIVFMPFSVKATSSISPTVTDYKASILDSSFDSFYKYLKYKINYEYEINSGLTYDNVKEKLSDTTFKQDLSYISFISTYGVTNLDSISQSDEGKSFLTWLFKNPNIIDEFLCGGVPRGNDYLKALSIFKEIWTAYPESHSGIYLKIAIATSLEHASPIGTGWYQIDADNHATIIDPLSRYNNYVTAHKEGKLYPVFDTLDIWHMRLVVGAWITDDDLNWARETYAGAHSIVDEKGVERNFDTNYNRNNITNAGHELQYNLFNANGISVQNGALSYYGPNATLKTVLKVGGVCGAIAKYGTSIAQAYGVPAVPVGQPGHAAAIYNKEDGLWAIHNNISGFGESFFHGGTTIPWDGNISARYVNGNGDERSANFAPAYVLLYEDASSDSNSISQSELLRLLANEIDETDIANSIRKMAIKTCPKNILIWRDYISSLKSDNSFNNNDWIDLNNEIISTFINHPRPMTELLTSIESKVLNDESEEFKANYVKSIFKAYESVESSNQVQIRDIIERSMPKWMFEYIPKPEIKFNFDGDNSCTLVGFKKGMSFSVDNGKTFFYPSESDYKLSISEINKLIEEKQILIRNKYSSSTSLDKITVIKIDGADSTPINVSGDDDKNTIIGIDTTMEFSINNGISWTMYDGENLPDLTSNITLLVRKPGQGLTPPSKTIEIIYTAQLDLALNKATFASSTYNNGSTSGAVDGKSGSSWLCAGGGSQWFYVDLGKTFNINGVKLDWGTNPAYWQGYATKYKIQVSNEENITDDFKNWIDVYSTDSGDGKIDTISFEPIKARYVRISADEVAGGWWYSIHDFQVYDGTSVPTEMKKTGVTYLSDMLWSSCSNGWGKAGADMSVNGATNKSGQRISLDGKQYIKGLGLHADSIVQYNLEGKYNTFSADIGIDDEVNGSPSGATVTYEVIKDATTIYKSETITKDSPIEHLNLDITGANTLTLKISNNGDGNASDHADWADAYVIGNNVNISDIKEDVKPIQPEPDLDPKPDLKPDSSSNSDSDSKPDPVPSSSSNSKSSTSSSSSNSNLNSTSNESTKKAGTIKVNNKFNNHGEVELNLDSQINEDSLNNNSLYVEDSKGNRIKTTFNYDSTSKSITLTPTSNYNNGEVYTVCINDKLLSKDGTTLFKKSKYKFIALDKNLKLNESKKVSLNKEWVVKLNMPLDSSKFSSSSIKLYDEECNLVDVRAAMVDNKTIKVVPKENYDANAKYYLFAKDLISEDGHNLKDISWIEFTTSN